MANSLLKSVEKTKPVSKLLELKIPGWQLIILNMLIRIGFRYGFWGFYTEGGQKGKRAGGQKGKRAGGQEG